MASKHKIAHAPIRNLMKDSGAELVARDAVEELINMLENQAKTLTKRALALAEHAKRKKITVDDLRLAATQL